MHKSLLKLRNYHGAWRLFCLWVQAGELKGFLTENPVRAELNDHRLPDRSRNERAGERKNKRHSRDQMVLNRRPLNGRPSSPADDVTLISLRWNLMRRVAASFWESENFNYLASAPANLNNWLLNSCSHQRRGVASRRFPSTGRRIPDWHHLARPQRLRPSLLTARLLWNKGQAIRHLEGQLICHPLINASAANLRSRTPAERLTASKQEAMEDDGTASCGEGEKGMKLHFHSAGWIFLDCWIVGRSRQ